MRRPTPALGATTIPSQVRGSSTSLPKLGNSLLPNSPRAPGSNLVLVPGRPTPSDSAAAGGIDPGFSDRVPAPISDLLAEGGVREPDHSGQDRREQLGNT